MNLSNRIYVYIAEEFELALSLKYFCCTKREKICQSVPPTCHSIMFNFWDVTGDLTQTLKYKLYQIHLACSTSIVVVGIVSYEMFKTINRTSNCYIMPKMKVFEYFISLLSNT